MNLRRSLVWIVSIVFGLLSTVGVIMAFGTTLDKFSIANAILVFLSTGSIAFIWLDFLFRTQYLRN